MFNRNVQAVYEESFYSEFEQTYREKTLFLVFVQSPAVSFLLVLSCLLVMAEGTFFIDY